MQRFGDERQFLGAGGLSLGRRPNERPNGGVKARALSAMARWLVGDENLGFLHRPEPKALLAPMVAVHDRHSFVIGSHNPAIFSSR
jgi:hypothetical protein